jgi:beta-RFAP synthase
MADAPAVRIAVEPAADWSATGPNADRAVTVARRLTDRPHRVVVEACPPEHVGLGVGTQLSLAVARALAPNRPAVELAGLAGRGERSAIGVYGFGQGGFLVDGGRREGGGLAPLVARVEFPADWRVVLLIPEAPGRWHGEVERDVFDTMSAAADDALCRLVLLGLLPALGEYDLPAFGGALAEYNARAGELFRAAQGGTYTAAAAELIAWLRRQGVDGVGQTSWGPTAFAVVEDEGRAAALAAAARRALPAITATVAAGRNNGANAPGARGE